MIREWKCQRGGCDSDARFPFLDYCSYRCKDYDLRRAAALMYDGTELPPLPDEAACWTPSEMQERINELRERPVG